MLYNGLLTFKLYQVQEFLVEANDEEPAPNGTVLAVRAGGMILGFVTGHKRGERGMIYLVRSPRPLAIAELVAAGVGLNQMFFFAEA